MAGRPKKEIDIEKVQTMASYACTQEEIADEMGFERTLFHTREDIKEAFRIGFNKAKTRLRVAQFKAAEAGNTSLLIWLGKQYLGQREPKDIQAQDVSELPDDELSKSIMSLAGGMDAECRE